MSHLYASLGNCDSLLLHDLMDCHTIILIHLVKLIDADYSAISQHHRTCLKALVTSFAVTWCVAQQQQQPGLMSQSHGCRA